MAQYDLYDFDEYSAQLAPANQAKINEIATDVDASRATAYPVVSISITGYADIAWNQPASERAAFEMNVSINRANAALEKLQAAIRARGGDVAVDAVQFSTSGQGSRFRVFENPQNEVERRRNRRVVISVYRLQDTPIHPLPPLPPIPPPDPDEDPNVVIAGTRFRIKLMDGASIGLAVGGFGYTFVVWDVDHSRAAVYFYTGVAAMGGVTSPLSGESEWASFTTTRPVQVDQMSGEASHSVVTLPLSFMQLNIPVATVTLDLGGGWIAGVEAGSGLFNYIVGSVKIFRGD